MADFAPFSHVALIKRCEITIFEYSERVKTDKSEMLRHFLNVSNICDIQTGESCPIFHM